MLPCSILARKPVGGQTTRAANECRRLRVSRLRPLQPPQQRPRTTHTRSLFGRDETKQTREAGPENDGLLGCSILQHHEGQPLPSLPISRSDEHFMKMGIEFVTDTHALDLEELNELFARVGFPRRDLTKLAVALKHTFALVWVRSTRQSRFAKLGQVLGFARATSDGVFCAVIWDVAVLPSWQGEGLGRALIERLTASLVDEHITSITLFAEPNVVGMYERMDFMADPCGVKGMTFRPPYR